MVVNKGRESFASKINREGAKVFIEAPPTCKKSRWSVLSKVMDWLAIPVPFSLWKVRKRVEFFTPKYH
jgi:hypothetical protein